MTWLCLIEESAGWTRSALLIDGRIERIDISFPGEQEAGAVRRARIRAKLPEADARLLDLGGGMDGFLPQSAKPRGGLMMEEGAYFPVLLLAPPHESGKGWKTTADFRLKGRYLSLDPARKGIEAGKDCPTDASALEALRQSLKDLTGEAALILGPAAFGTSVEAVRAEALRLLEDARRLHGGKATGEILAAPEPLNRLMRQLPAGAGRILAADAALHARLRQLCSQDYPDLLPDVACEREGSASLFERHGVEDRIEQILSGHIALPSGGALHIDETRAATVIDIDAAMAARFESNREAAREIPLLLRQAQIGGLALIDFIEGMTRQQQATLLKALDQGLTLDALPVNRSHFTSHGVVSLTRRRDGLSLRQRLLQRGAWRPSPEAEIAALLQAAEKLLQSTATGAGAPFILLPPPLHDALTPRHIRRFQERTGFSLSIKRGGEGHRPEIGRER